MNIEDLISQYIDGELSSEAEAELHHRLSVSPEDRTLFREHVDLRDAARSRQLQHQPSRAMEMALFARLAAEQEAEVPEPAMERSAEPATLRPLEPLPAAPLPRPMAADASPVRSDQAPTRPVKRRRLLPILVPFVIGVAAMGIFWKIYSGSIDTSGELVVDNMKGGSSSQTAPAPAATGTEPAIVNDATGATSDPQESISSPLSTGNAISDAPTSSYRESDYATSRRKSGAGSGYGARSSSGEGSVSAWGGSGAVRSESANGPSEDFSAPSVPPPPPSAPATTQNPDQYLANQSYDTRRGLGGAPPREQEIQSNRMDDGALQNAAPTPIEPPKPIQAEAKEKSQAMLDTPPQEPRQFAESMDQRAVPEEQQQRPTLAKRNGKPAAAPTPPPAGTITQLGDAYFDPDRATLKETSRESLDNLVDLMNSYPDMRIEIQGHTDSDGSEDRNTILSESRARSVMEYLRRNGIPAGRMEIQGFGPSAPLAPNTTAAGKKLNRRVVVRVKDYGFTNSTNTK